MGATGAIDPALFAAFPASDVRQVQAASPVLFYPQDVEGFRRITAASSARDLTPPMQDRMQQVSYYLYATNPMARRIIEITKDYVVGEGITFEAEDKQVQAELDAFAKDPVNRLSQNLHSYVRELGMFGELCLFCGSNPIDGNTRLGYIDPSVIDGVEYATLEGLPGIAVAQPITAILRKQPGEREARRLTIVHREEDPYSRDFGRLVGECFLWQINKARAGTRGISDIFPLADWIDGLDQMLFAVMSQVDSLSRFIWDVKMTGSSEEQIEAWLKKNGAAPKANTIRAHNEKVEWHAVAPTLNAWDKENAVRMIKNFCLGGSGMPEHWFADGGATTRATALEQGEPTLKTLTTRQLFVKEAIIEEIGQYVIDRKIAAGVLPRNVNRKFKAKTPDLSVRDQAKSATALATAINGLVAAKTMRAVDRKTITRFVSMIGQSMGLEVDVDEVLAAAEADQQSDELRDFTRTPYPKEPGEDGARDTRDDDTAEGGRG